jgi:hypothetical protein
MATKAIRAGIPLIATISAPTSLAAEIARDRGVTLVGYLRGGRMNVYTHPERLKRNCTLTLRNGSRSLIRHKVTLTADDAKSSFR